MIWLTVKLKVKHLNYGKDVFNVFTFNINTLEPVALKCHCTGFINNIKVVNILLYFCCNFVLCFQNNLYLGIGRSLKGLNPVHKVIGIVIHTVFFRTMRLLYDSLCRDKIALFFRPIAGLFSVMATVTLSCRTFGPLRHSHFLSTIESQNIVITIFPD